MVRPQNPRISILYLYLSFLPAQIALALATLFALSLAATRAV